MPQKLFILKEVNDTKHILTTNGPFKSLWPSQKCFSHGLTANKIIHAMLIPRLPKQCVRPFFCRISG